MACDCVERVVSEPSTYSVGLVAQTERLTISEVSVVDDRTLQQREGEEGGFSWQLLWH